MRSLVLHVSVIFVVTTRVLFSVGKVYRVTPADTFILGYSLIFRFRIKTSVGIKLHTERPKVFIDGDSRKSLGGFNIETDTFS